MRLPQVEGLTCRLTVLGASGGTAGKTGAQAEKPLQINLFEPGVPFTSPDRPIQVTPNLELAKLDEWILVHELRLGECAFLRHDRDTTIKFSFFGSL